MNYKNLISLTAACRLCPRGCNVDRSAGERGYCGAGAVIEVAHAGLHHGEEPPVSGTRGSGTIFFRQCTLRCVFCQNWQISQPEARGQERDISNERSPMQLATVMLQLQAQGAHNINLVSPTQYIAGIAEALMLAKEQGLRAPVVYNTSGYESVEVVRALEGLIDIYLPDIKYADDALAAKYSGAVRYVERNRAAIAEMFRQVGHLECDADGIARKGIIVRHLVLPNGIAGSRSCLEFLATLSKKIDISLMAQYSPQHRALQYPELSRSITPEEYQAVLSYAEELRLENCWGQELSSRDIFLPDFQQERPFGG